MSHKCIVCWSVWINDDRTYCISCEKSLFGNGGIRNGQESSGSIDDSGDETSEE